MCGYIGFPMDDAAAGLPTPFLFSGRGADDAARGGYYQIYRSVLRNSRSLKWRIPGYSLSSPLTGSIDTTYFG